MPPRKLTTAAQVVKELKACGTAQNRKIYKRHGVTGDQFGVSFAHLRRLQRRLKTNHEMAVELWAIENHDVRMLAALIADPDALTRKEADTWVKDVGNYILTQVFSYLVARSPFVLERIETWTKSRSEFVAACGWEMVGHLANDANDKLRQKDEYFFPFLERIARKIHSQKNRTRYSMNDTLICIGSRNVDIQYRAMTVATRIGRVHVDHDGTECETPDALFQIMKAANDRERDAERRKKRSKKASKRSAKKATRKTAAKRAATKKKAVKKAAKRTTKKAAKKATKRSAKKRKASRAR